MIIDQNNKKEMIKMMKLYRFYFISIQYLISLDKNEN